MEDFVAAAVLLALGGIGLVVFGWRGRRVDRHPLCARCGFDLIGRPIGATRCAECGADISGLAIRVGHRARRARPLYGGLAMMLPALLVISVFTYVQVRGIDITPHKPGWWLRQELTAATPEAAEIAFNEFARRMLRGDLADVYVVATADYCLEKQDMRTVTWKPAWGMFIETARQMGRLPEDRWSRYALQSLRVAFLPGPTIYPGDPVPLELSFAKDRVVGVEFAALFDWEDVRIGGARIGRPSDLISVHGHHGMMKRVGQKMEVTHGNPRIDGKHTLDLTPGRHEISATLTMRPFDARQLGEDGKRAPEEESLLHAQLELRGSFQVADASVGWPAGRFTAPNAGK